MERENKLNMETLGRVVDAIENYDLNVLTSIDDIHNYMGLDTLCVALIPQLKEGRKVVPFSRYMSVLSYVLTSITKNSQHKYENVSEEVIEGVVERFLEAVANRKFQYAFANFEEGVTLDNKQCFPIVKDGDLHAAELVLRLCPQVNISQNILMKVQQQSPELYEICKKYQSNEMEMEG